MLYSLGIILWKLSTVESLVYMKYFYAGGNKNI